MFAKSNYPKWVPNVRAFPDKSTVVIPPPLALALAQAKLCSPIDLADYYDVSHAQLATGFLLEYLKGDRPEDAAVQTKLVEMNLAVAPQVANAILTSGTVSHYDKHKVAVMCERAGLVTLAVQHYTQFVDIRRVLRRNYHLVPTEWIITYQ
jgi:clathrin heavy chain